MDSFDVGRRFSVFAGTHRIACGSLAEAGRAAEHAQPDTGPVLIFDRATGEVVDMPLEVVDAATTSAQPEATRRGRPKLGVVAREVTLLPRQWEWLSRQRGGASAVLRRLVDEARRAEAANGADTAAREATHRFMTTMAGDLPGYEEALRCLYRGDHEGFAARIEPWPADVREEIAVLSQLGWSHGTGQLR